MTLVKTVYDTDRKRNLIVCCLCGKPIIGAAYAIRNVGYSHYDCTDVKEVETNDISKWKSRNT